MYTCGWCKTHYEDWSANCPHCGGAMPPKSAGELGPDPGPLPRELPRNFQKHLFGVQSFNIIAGTVFFLVGGAFLFEGGLKSFVALFPGLFLVGGFFMAKNGIVCLYHILKLLRQGEAVVGRITEVCVDRIERMNKQAPRRVSYEFEDKATGQLHSGHFQTWNPSAYDRNKGDKTWVLYLQSKPSINTVFPPVA